MEPSVTDQRTLDQRLAAIAAEIADIGIAKTHKNAQQGNYFRGIDDITKAFAPILAKHGVIVMPAGVHDVSREERKSKSGGTLIYSVAVYDFAVIGGGGAYRGCMIGEAMDSGDKGLSKCGSIAYREFLLKTFCVPVEATEDNERDFSSPELAPKEADAPIPPPPDRDPPKARTNHKKGSVVAKFHPRWPNKWAGHPMRDAPFDVLARFIKDFEDKAKLPDLDETKKHAIQLYLDAANEDWERRVAEADQARLTESLNKELGSMPGVQHPADNANEAWGIKPEIET